MIDFFGPGHIAMISKIVLRLNIDHFHCFGAQDER
jgi:hypothetical protein